MAYSRKKNLKNQNATVEYNTLTHYTSMSKYLSKTINIVDKDIADPVTQIG